MSAKLGTSLTPGFTELLANWDHVLQSLDRVSAYTAERAQDPPSARLGHLRTERPPLFGQTPEGFEWQNLSKLPTGGYPQEGTTQLPQEAVDAQVEPPWAAGTAASARPVRHKGRSEVALERFDRHLARKEAQDLLQLVLRSWRTSCAAKAPAPCAGQGPSDTLTTEKEKLRRTWKEQFAQRLQTPQPERRPSRLSRIGRCTDAALQCWKKAELRETLGDVFQVWREDVFRRKVEAWQREEAKRVRTDAAQASEVQSALHRELEASRAAQQDAVAEAASSRMALQVAQEEVGKLKAELAATNDQLLQVKEAPVAAPPRMAESDRSRHLTDLSIKLAKAEAEASEAKAQAEPLKMQLVTVRRQLEVAYALLNKEPQDARKGNSRDRDLAVTHLWQVLERLQDVPTEEEKKRSENSPSAMSTPNIQSSLSLPSLSTASSPSVRSRSKPMAGLERFGSAPLWSQ